jgi:adenylate cyclase, class 2
MKEIEILIEVKSDKETALKKLEGFNTQGIKKVLDIYYRDPLRKNLQPQEGNRLLNAFRLRQKDRKNSIAYKVDHFDGDTWVYSDEHETEVKDFETMQNILKNLGFEELIRIDNEKHTFETDEYEIVLEEVKDLGLFMEVEKKTQVPDGEVETTKEDIRIFLKGLNIELGEEQNSGKPELMLRRRG